MEEKNDKDKNGEAKEEVVKEKGEEDGEFYLYKVVLVGESGVGKTSIINRYVMDKFANEFFPTTIRSSFQKKLNVGNKNLNFTIWDTCGQEQYRSMTKDFYRNAVICLLVYDITNQKSFQEVKAFWFDDAIKNRGKEIIFGLAGNKSDLQEKKVSDEEASDWAQANNVIFGLTSAAESRGIDDLFKRLASKLIETEKKEKPEKKLKLEDNKRKGNEKKWC